MIPDPLSPSFRKNLLAMLIGAFLWCVPAEAALPFANRAAMERTFPDTNALPGLRRVERPRRVRVRSLSDVLGADAVAVHVRNGVNDYAEAHYDFEGQRRSVTIGIAAFPEPLHAAAAFHEYRIRFLHRRGEAVPVGAEGVLDARNGGRNLYFYKQRTFVRVIYSGDRPIPDLLPLARLVADAIPGDDRPPTAIEALRIEGIDPSTLTVTLGPLFQLDFFPRAATAGAPGAGMVSDASVAVFPRRAAAEDAAKAYQAYLQRNGEDFQAGVSPGGLSWWRATDPEQGRVIAAVRGNVLHIVARPQNYDAGLAFLERMAAE
jgi:hypothetical protein